MGNGREALRTLRDGYDACLILLDLTMPIMDGWKFRKAQKADAALASIPVAVLTTLRDTVVEAEKLEAIAGFAKPLDCEALLRLVSQHCPRDHEKRRDRLPRRGTRPPAGGTPPG